jgi:hypothetical protein
MNCDVWLGRITTMTPTFNTKIYQQKERVYSAVPKAPRISRLWIWDEAAREYKNSASGNIYYAASMRPTQWGVSAASTNPSQIWKRPEPGNLGNPKCQSLPPLRRRQVVPYFER